MFNPNLKPKNFQNSKFYKHCIKLIKPLLLISFLLFISSAYISLNCNLFVNITSLFFIVFLCILLLPNFIEISANMFFVLRIFFLWLKSHLNEILIFIETTLTLFIFGAIISIGSYMISMKIISSFINSTENESSLQLLIALILSIPIMFLLDLFFCSTYLYRKSDSKLWDIQIGIQEFLATVLLTFLIGTSTYISNNLKLLFFTQIESFPESLISEAFNFIFQILFAFTLCFHVAFKTSYKIMIKNSK